MFRQNLKNFLRVVSPPFSIRKFNFLKTLVYALSMMCVELVPPRGDGNPPYDCNVIGKRVTPAQETIRILPYHVRTTSQSRPVDEWLNASGNVS